ncbi:hypothetical protein LAZ67_14003419 [Cordylochernes scorpioides]|uniref:Uncharacterized protein n=1 Tax=Cordylochernes scorpioides TaxID=51811 RepID=A0ABY6L7Y1_9ARAC|nr:hypothetical protein LAZ67_14003419 [Cordylochernes scorpioides]
MYSNSIIDNPVVRVPDALAASEPEMFMDNKRANNMMSAIKRGIVEECCRPTVKCWFEKFEDILNSWAEFKIKYCEIFGNKEDTARKAENIL